MDDRELSDDELAGMTPNEFRNIVRKGEWTSANTMACRGYAHANLAIVPEDFAFEFSLFCFRNPRACPLVDITEPGNPHPPLMAPEADLRTDLPRYRVFENGQPIDDPTDILAYWRDDLVAFLIGCSVSFDWILRDANVEFRPIGAFTSNIACISAGRFHGHVVVSGRLVKGVQNVVRIVQISSRYLSAHGPPLHIGDPTSVGISNPYHPDITSFDVITPRQPDEMFMFFGCGITPQAVALESRVPFMITHLGNHMFVTDRRSEELAVL